MTPRSAEMGTGPSPDLRTTNVTYGRSQALRDGRCRAKRRRRKGPGTAKMRERLSRDHDVIRVSIAAGQWPSKGFSIPGRLLLRELFSAIYGSL